MVYLHTYYVTKRDWKKILSHLVRWVQGTQYDHAGFGISDDGSRAAVIHEATLSGVIATDYQDFMDNHSYIVIEFKIPITNEELRAIVQVIGDNKGKKYGTLQLFGNAFAIIMRKWFNWNVKKNIFRNGWKKLICSEYLGKVLTVVGAVLPEGMDYEGIDITHCVEMNKNITKSIRMK